MDPAKPLHDLTAADLMSPTLITLPESMPLREAARALIHHGVSGAPVVDGSGRCIGVLSAADYLRRAAGTSRGVPHTREPVTCSFQTTHRRADGRDEVLCTLAPGACPIQMQQVGPDGEERIICREPHAVPVDWQVVELENLPADDVGRFMTPDPVMAAIDTPIHTLARMMIDGRIHRVIITDADRRPAGVVSSTDLLAALAYSNRPTRATRA